jgi:hypothetical protein
MQTSVRLMHIPTRFAGSLPRAFTAPRTSALRVHRRSFAAQVGAAAHPLTQLCTKDC